MKLLTARCGVVLVVSLLLASGCGSDKVEAGAAGEPSEQAKLPTQIILSIQDHGRTIRVSRSTRVTLELGGRFRWTVPKSGGAVEANEVVPDDGTSAQAWELRARRSGLARVTSVGSPACQPASTGCPQPRSYTVTLEVR